MVFLASKYYEIVTEESAEQGEAAEQGDVFEDQEFTFRELIQELREYSELSCSRVTMDTCSHIWASTEPDQDYRTGEETSYTIHIKSVDGQELSSRQLYRIYRAAKLTS